MAATKERRWLLAAVACWIFLMAAAVTVIVYVHHRSVAILDRLVATDPSPDWRANRLRLDADSLVREALLIHEQSATGTIESALAESRPFCDEAIALLEKAERLYLESLDAQSSQPAVLFQLGEVNFLLGRRSRAYRYLAAFWEARGDDDLARVYRNQARRLDGRDPTPPYDGRTTSGNSR